VDALVKPLTSFSVIHLRLSEPRAERERIIGHVGREGEWACHASFARPGGHCAGGEARVSGG
jgi:hypothetical protein